MRERKHRNNGKSLGCSPNHVGSCWEMRKPCRLPVAQSLPPLQVNSSPPRKELLLWRVPQENFRKGFSSAWVPGLLMNNPCIWKVSFAFVPVSLLFLDSRGFYPLMFLARQGSWVTVGSREGVGPSPTKYLECTLFRWWPRMILLPEGGEGMLRGKTSRCSLTPVNSSHKLIRTILLQRTWKAARIHPYWWFTLPRSCASIFLWNALHGCRWLIWQIKL